LAIIHAIIGRAITQISININFNSIIKPPKGTVVNRTKIISNLNQEIQVAAGVQSAETSTNV
jgi:hypothetical protein